MTISTCQGRLPQLKQNNPATTASRAEAIEDNTRGSTQQQQVERAKELLSGEADFEGQSFDEWLGAVPTVQPVVVEEKELSNEEPEKQPKTYSHDHIERMGPEMREKIILQILVKGIRKMEQGEVVEGNGGEE